MATELQFWQSNLLKDIMNNGDSEYNKTFRFPRRSGVTSFMGRLISEISLLTNDSDRILLIVDNRMIKAEIEFVLTTPNSMSSMFGGSVKIPENIKIITNQDAINNNIPFTNYIDWVITDNAFWDFNLDIIVNNSIEFWTS